MKYIKGKNKYGFYSGGFITDMLDKIALRAINEKYPQTKRELWFTSSATVDFKKQLCDLKKLTHLVDAIETAGIIYTCAALYQEKTLIAIGNFTFKKAKHNYCETKD